MAVYNPPQPFWKRAIVGCLDLFFAFVATGNVVQVLVNLFGGSAGTIGTGDSYATANGPGFELSGLPAFIVIVLVIAYFPILGRTGGTVFQRVFGFKRA